MIDFDAMLFQPTFGTLGVLAMLTTTSGIVEITVIDETRAKSNTTGSLETRSLGPQAIARIPELIEKGVDRSEWDGLPISFNNGFWVIRSHDPLGSPNGENAGLVRFFLKASND